MPALLSLLGSALPYLLLVVGVIAGYFSIKHKGVVEERARQVEKQAEAKAAVEKAVVAAVSKDAAIDAHVAEIITAKKESHVAPIDPPGRFNF